MSYDVSGIIPGFYHVFGLNIRQLALSGPVYPVGQHRLVTGSSVTILRLLDIKP
jgi:hypothetical protein